MKENITYKMSLISKNIKVVKICKTKKQCYIFERDMPAKYNLLFSKTPYMIGTEYIYND